MPSLVGQSTSLHGLLRPLLECGGDTGSTDIQLTDGVQSGDWPYTASFAGKTAHHGRLASFLHASPETVAPTVGGLMQLQRRFKPGAMSAACSHGASPSCSSHGSSCSGRAAASLGAEFFSTKPIEAATRAASFLGAVEDFAAANQEQAESAMLRAQVAVENGHIALEASEVDDKVAHETDEIEEIVVAIQILMAAISAVLALEYVRLYWGFITFAAYRKKAWEEWKKGRAPPELAATAQQPASPAAGSGEPS